MDHHRPGRRGRGAACLLHQPAAEPLPLRRERLDRRRAVRRGGRGRDPRAAAVVDGSRHGRGLRRAGSAGRGGRRPVAAPQDWPRAPRADRLDHPQEQARPARSQGQPLHGGGQRNTYARRADCRTRRGDRQARRGFARASRRRGHHPQELRAAADAGRPDPEPEKRGGGRACRLLRSGARRRAGGIADGGRGGGGCRPAAGYRGAPRAARRSRYGRDVLRPLLEDRGPDTR